MKLERYKNPARELRIAYGQNKGKAYTEVRRSLRFPTPRQRRSLGTRLPSPAPINTAAQPRDTPESAASSPATPPLSSPQEEDRFLLCCIPKVGYGNWDDLKAEIRKHWLFRFDWRAARRPSAARRYHRRNHPWRKPWRAGASERGAHLPSLLLPAAHPAAGSSRAARRRSWAAAWTCSCASWRRSSRRSRRRT